jgi:hypothetical protein
LGFVSSTQPTLLNPTYVAFVSTEGGRGAKPPRVSVRAFRPGRSLGAFLAGWRIGGNLSHQRLGHILTLQTKRCLAAYVEPEARPRRWGHPGQDIVARRLPAVKITTGSLLCFKQVMPV